MNLLLFKSRLKYLISRKRSRKTTTTTYGNTREKREQKIISFVIILCTVLQYYTVKKISNFMINLI